MTTELRIVAQPDGIVASATPVTRPREEPDRVQAELFPRDLSRSITASKRIPLAEIWAPYPRRAADAQLRDSIRQYGILTPLLVMRLPGPGGEVYRLVAGRRRWEVARADGMKFVLCSILQSGDPNAAAITEAVVQNDNPAAELAQVEDLLGRGFSERDIVRATRMPQPRMRKIMRLQALIDPLRGAFDRGEISPRIAFGCAVLAREAQERLADILEQTKMITADDLKNERAPARQVAAQSALAGLEGAESDESGLPPRSDVITAFSALWERVMIIQADGVTILDPVEQEALYAMAERLGLE